MITNESLFDGADFTLDFDRLNRSASSLYLYTGNLRARNDYYMYDDFTLSFWVKIKANIPYSRFLIIQRADASKIYFSLSDNNNLRPYFLFQNGLQQSNTALVINKWQHLAYTIQGTTLSIYIDGQSVYNGQTTPINYELQSNVLFGGVHSGNNSNPNALFDDIRIFNKSLSQTELIACSQIYL